MKNIVNNKKVIVRMKGGLGNQLFCYAAARRLAYVNDAELVIDDVTGFIRDKRYRRRYELDKFNVKVRKATPKERMEPFERARRCLAKFESKGKPYYQRQYVGQEGEDFDARLITFKVERTVYLDGYWQSERYFKDVESIIRKDLEIRSPSNPINKRLSDKMRGVESIAIHVRWFDSPRDGIKPNNVLKGYYQRAIAEIKRNIKDFHCFIFSDDPVAARNLLEVSDKSLTIVDHNNGKENAYLDLWLMSQCKHFIIANSTFSWWGAWLSRNKNKIIVAPAKNISGICSWGFEGLIPEAWIKI